MTESNKLNENIVKFTGMLSILEGLEVDKSYRVGLDIDCYSKEKRSRQDGSHNMVFKGKIVGGEILKSTGEVIKTKDKNSPSKKLRFAIMKQCEENGLDFQEVYEPKMMHIISLVINNAL